MKEATKAAQQQQQQQPKQHNKSNGNCSKVESSVATSKQRLPLILNLRTDSQITSAAAAASIESSLIDRATKLLDKMNRARAKLEKQSERQMTFVGRDVERLEIEDYYWWVRPSDMNDALAKIANNTHTTTDYLLRLRPCLPLVINRLK